MLVISRETFPCFISIKAKLIILGFNIIASFTVYFPVDVKTKNCSRCSRSYSEVLLGEPVKSGGVTGGGVTASSCYVPKPEPQTASLCEPCLGDSWRPYAQNYPATAA